MLKRNLVANYFGQGWVALMGLAFIPLYVKYLGIEAYGLIGLYAVLNAWLGLLDMGMTPTLSREMARFLGGGHTPQSIRDLLRSIEVVALAIAVLIVAGVALSAHWLASSWLKADNLPVQTVSEAFVVMGAVTALRFVEGIYRSSLIGLSRQVFYNVVNSILATVRGLGAVFVLVWVSPTIQAFFFWQGLVSAITLATLTMMTYSTLPRGERSGRFLGRRYGGLALCKGDDRNRFPGIAADPGGQGCAFKADLPGRVWLLQFGRCCGWGDRDVRLAGGPGIFPAPDHALFHGQSRRARPDVSPGGAVGERRRGERGIGADCLR